MGFPSRRAWGKRMSLCKLRVSEISNYATIPLFCWGQIALQIRVTFKSSNRYILSYIFQSLAFSFHEHNYKLCVFKSHGHLGSALLCRQKQQQFNARSQLIIYHRFDYCFKRSIGNSNQSPSSLCFFAEKYAYFLCTFSAVRPYVYT